ncbi:uncharacterized protein BXZ73DRAFT_107163 [Epithele typhae]|uniref:uncharacterized protein n=1 Tax=Epithele typhae TaxID=378194 RepID=UPI00200780B1|nr:uncharacterized protein BXZ73DRAFT_107163 [Epithele typhae]KAH9912927.1 hypothetical protein BXZ73DRAFT_107163 [Epithele typhae]
MCASTVIARCGRTFWSGRPLILPLPSTTFHAGQSAWDCGHKYPTRPSSHLLLAVAPQLLDFLSATPRLSVLHGFFLLIPNAREKTFPSTSLPTVHLPAEYTAGRVFRRASSHLEGVDEHAAQDWRLRRATARGTEGALPIFYNPMQASTGTDDVVDLFDLLDIGSLSADRLSELVFFFRSVRDGTPSRLRSSVPATTKEHAGRLTLLNIHGATITRDLCLVVLLT